MPTFEVESGGKSYEVEAPHLDAATAALGRLPPGFVLDQQGPGPRADAAAPVPAAGGLPQGFVLDQPSVAADVAKSGGIGLAKGGISVAGLPGELVSRIDQASAWLAGKLGEDPAKTAADQAKLRASPFTLPTSGDIQGKIEGVTGKFYEPQTTAGKYAQTVGEFAPAALGGPGGLAARVARQAVIPGVASEAAGQATAGTAAEPYARMGAGLAGGLTGSLRRAPAAAEAPTLDAINAARGADYGAVKDLGVTVKPEALQRATKGITENLAGDGLDATMAPKTLAVLERLGSRAEPATITEIDNTRKILGQISKGASSPSSAERIEAGAARRAINSIDELLPSLAESDFASGAANHAKAIEHLTSARGNAATAFKTQALDRAAYRAENNAAAANSGLGGENALRQQLKSILNSPAKSAQFNADELAQIKAIVRGEGVRNVVRGAGNILSGGGGLGMLGSAAFGHMAIPGFGLAAPAIGYALKKAGNAATERAFANLNNNVRSNSPLGQAMPQPVAPARTDPRLAALLAAIQARPKDTAAGVLGQMGTNDARNNARGYY